MDETWEGKVGGRCTVGDLPDPHEHILLLLHVSSDLQGGAPTRLISPGLPFSISPPLWH
jgi:hypothetical protein